MKLVVGNRVTYKYKNDEEYTVEILTNKRDILGLEADIEKGLIEYIKVEACNWEEIEFEEVNNEVNEIEEILEREE